MPRKVAGVRLPYVVNGNPRPAVACWRVGPTPEIAAVRRSVRAAVADLAPGDLVLVACSGGPDSVALAVALAHEAPRAGLRAGAVTVDHGLQPGSADRAAEVAAQLVDLGLAPVEVATATVGGSGGPEGAARTARYLALDEAADRLGAAAVLLGHTRDDQAETVLLGLARGSGARSLAGMPPTRGRYRRPLLDLPRDTVRKAAAGHPTWADPHNDDPAFARTRVRRELLPVLERELGPGVAAALARSADQLRADADALDDWAALALEPGPRCRRGPRRDGAGRPAHRRTDSGAAARSHRRRQPALRPHRRPRPASWTGWSATGTARARSTCPGAWRRPGRVARLRFPASRTAVDEGAPPRGREAAGHRPREGARLRGADPRPAGRDGRRHRPRLRGQGPAARRRAQGRGDGDGRPGPRPRLARRDGLDGGVVLRLGHQVLRAWCGSSRTSTGTSPAGTS